MSYDLERRPDDDRSAASEPEVDPWAPGGSMSTAPIPPARPVFEPAPAQRPPDEDGAGGDPAAAPTTAGRNKLLIAVGVVIALVVAGALITSRDDEGEEGAAPTSQAPPTTEEPILATAPPESRPEDGMPPSLSDVNVAVDSVTDVSEALPPVLAGIAPTELLVATEPGILSQIDTATGLSRVLVGQDFVDSPRVTAGADTAVFWSEGDDRIAVLRRRSAPAFLTTDVALADVVAQTDGEFLLVPAPFSSGPARELRVEPVVRTTELGPIIATPGLLRPHPGGQLMTPSIFGTDLIDGDGTVQISAGLVVAQSNSQVLFREGDETDACVLVLETPATGESVRFDDVVAGEEAPERNGWALSPDGATIARVADIGGPLYRIVDLETGHLIELRTEAVPTVPSWAPDSSGFFGVVAGDIVFVDRLSGQFSVSDLPTDATSVVARADPENPDLRSGTDGGVVLTLTDLTGLDLVAFGSSGEVIRIDVDSRTTITYPGLASTSGAPSYVFPDADGVTVASYDNVPGFRLDYGEELVELAGELMGGPLVPGPVPGSVWRVRDPVGPPGEVSVELVDAFGGALGSTIEVRNAVALGSDGTGGLLVSAPGGYYSTSPNGSVRLTDGQLLALGPTVAFARECDEVLTCAVVRIDRPTGDRIPVDDPQIVASDDLGFTVFELAGTSVSPDGEVVFVRAPRSGLSWSIVDLASGATTGIDGPASGTTIVWSADSRYAVFLSANELQIFDRTAASVTGLAQLPRIKAFAVEPPSPEPAGLTRRGVRRAR